MGTFAFANQEMLLVRLSNIAKQGKKISVLTGSGLTMPNLSSSELGVSTVSEIIQSIEEIFIREGQHDLFERSVKKEISDSSKYQVAMQTLLSCFGQDELNNVIVRAVLNAMINKPVVTSDNTEIDPNLLEQQPDNWYLRRGVDALGELFVDFNEIFAGPIFTSNFDPLIEVSIKKHNGSPQSIFIINDGKFLNQKSESNPVVHFHGYWHGSDTLHTVDQLRRERPLLKGDLKKVLSNSVLLVIGYGGWNDVFTKTLLELINEGNNNFDVLWCFFETGHSVHEKYEDLLKSMAPSIGQRLVLYSEIDCHKLFPSLLDKLNSEDKDLLRAPIVDTKLEAFPCDTPPSNLFWVGRLRELNQLKEDNFKVCFVTGFGGQGKSGLASHFVQSTLLETEFELWDWRDCKEEDNKFITIILSQIERLSGGVYRASKLRTEKIEDLVNLLFQVIKNRKIIFVYDNVDKYIDLVDFKPVGGLSILVDLALKQNHFSKFILTCRPQIKIVASGLSKIPLGELSITDTMNLFSYYKPPIAQSRLASLAKEAHDATNGHALWLNLFAAQAKRGGIEVANSFLKSYASQLNTSGPSISIAENVLNVVWKGLSPKQQLLLRGMSEMVVAFDKDELERIFANELGSNNQFNKAFNALNSLNLVVTKSAERKKDLFELHPLLKEYILNKYKSNERSKFIMMIVSFYDQSILFIKPKLDSNSPLSYFEKYTQKAELQIHDKNFKGALSSLQEIAKVIQSAGFVEEYLRVARELFENIDWLKAVTEEYTFFHDQFEVFVRCLVDLGKFEFSEDYLRKYLKVIPGKGLYYLGYCNMQSYLFWFRGDFKSSIDWAEKGIELQNETGVGKQISLSHHLALALRDTRQKENIERSLNIFLAGENLDDVLSPGFSKQNFRSSFFGNIGRCLWFKGMVKEALVCYVKSLDSLFNEREPDTIINRGYAGLWIAEVLFSKNMESEALYFLRYCVFNWEKAAPIKALNIHREFSTQLNSDIGINIQSTMTNWDIEKYCKEFIKNSIS